MNESLFISNDLVETIFISFSKSELRYHINKSVLFTVPLIKDAKIMGTQTL